LPHKKVLSGYLCSLTFTFFSVAAGDETCYGKIYSSPESGEGVPPHCRVRRLKRTVRFPPKILREGMGGGGYPLTVGQRKKIGHCQEKQFLIASLHPPAFTQDEMAGKYFLTDNFLKQHSAHLSFLRGHGVEGGQRPSEGRMGLDGANTKKLCCCRYCNKKIFASKN
jgi:hypothetical protein